MSARTGGLTLDNICRVTALNIDLCREILVIEGLSGRMTLVYFILFPDSFVLWLNRVLIPWTI